MMPSAGTVVGCKVLPICDLSMIGRKSFDGSSEKSSSDQSERRRRALSRMKELLRWAAAAKSNNSNSKSGSKTWKALYFRHRANRKASSNDDECGSMNSSKISFKISCSTTSSVYSPLSLPSISSRNNHQMWAKNSNSTSNPSTTELQILDHDANSWSNRSSKAEDNIRTAHWITTDSDFVVLEL